jgi:hypothetical protein
MIEPAERGTMPDNWPRETGSLLTLPQSPHVKWGRLFLRAFILNLAAVTVGWMLAHLLD